jgi:hypothetical protein
VTWDGRNETRDELASGIYFVSLRVSGEQRRRTVTLIR